jgi:hypothetical protein
MLPLKIKIASFGKSDFQKNENLKKIFLEVGGIDFSLEIRIVPFEEVDFWKNENLKKIFLEGRGACTTYTK